MEIHLRNETGSIQCAHPTVVDDNVSTQGGSSNYGESFS